MTLRILLADDHRMFREALRGLLHTEPGLEVVGEAHNGEQLLKLAQETEPDVVCVDINMPGLNGIDATRRLLANDSASKVIALSAHPDLRYVEEMLAAGALGYVTKGETGDHLLPAIQAARVGAKYLSPDVALIRVDAGAAAPTLGARETEIMQLLGAGHVPENIAQRLGMPALMVEAHQRNIMRRLNLHSLVDLTLYASRHF